MSTSRWSPASFILSGAPTAPAEISQAVERIRVKTESDEVLLVVMSPRRILRSVTISTEHSKLGAALNQHLHESNVAFDERAFQPSELAGLTDADLWARLTETMHLTEVRSDIEQHAVRILRPGNEVAAAKAMALVVLFSPVDEAQVSESDVQVLQLMVNTTANVDVSNDIIMTTTMTKLGDAIPESDALPITERDIDDLLRLVLETTNSEAAAVYRRAVNSANLTLQFATPSGSVEPSSDFVDARAASVLAVSVDERRPVFKSPDLVGLSTRTRGPRTLTSAWATRADESLHELAVPIPSAPLGRLGPPCGVITLCRLSERGQPHFRRYDLAVLRNLAVRLGFAFFANASARSNELFASSLATAQQGSQSGPWHETTMSPRASDLALPADYDFERRHLSKLVEWAAIATDSTSVSFRLLLPGDGRKRKRRELALVRTAAYPRERLLDPHTSIPLSKPNSINAWVARTGEWCYLPNVRDKQTTHRYLGLTGITEARPGTVSELCVPVRSAGQLVGTLNFESAWPSAFGSKIQLGKAIAAVLGSTLLSGRRRIVDRVLSFTSGVHEGSHEILQALDRVEAAVQNEKSASSPQDSNPQRPIAEVLTNEVKTIERLLEKSQRATPQSELDSGSPGRSVLDILEFTRKRLSFVAMEIDSNGMGTQVVRSANVPVVVSTLTEVFAGVQKYLARESLRRARVTGQELTIGGADHFAVTVRYRTSNALDQSLSQTLFRVPLFTTTTGLDRPHLGSYSAGAALREIGGEVNFRVVDHYGAEVIVRFPTIGERL